MSSEAVRKAAGTYIRDDIGAPPPVARWALWQCRHGGLAKHVQKFCAEQAEMLDPNLVLIETITSECIQCKVPFAGFDHESPHPYNSEVRFALNPVTGVSQRLG